MCNILTVSLIIALLEIINFINATNAISGTEIKLPCYADGEPLQSVTWEFFFMGDRQFILQYIVNDTDSAIGTTFTSLVADVNETALQTMFSIAEPNTTTQDYGMLTIRNISIFQAGQYRCTLTNVHGSESRTADVKVQREAI